MHPYMPDISEMKDMLAEMGLNDIMDLFSDIPSEYIIDELDLPEGMCEWDTYNHLRDLANRNMNTSNTVFFLGAGVYHHYVPPVVKEIISRSEFSTSYTPYQPEISQGMLQALFEYQSLIAELVGMDVANASMYDSATALGEAALMAKRITKKNTILVPEVMDWEKKSTLRNYINGIGMKIKEYRFDWQKGTHPFDTLISSIDDNTAAVYMECPNYFGVIEEDIVDIKEGIGENVIFIAGVNPISLGLLKRPGDYGADIVVGEGQPLGLGMNFGGPLLGIFATLKRYIRHMPGRLIGMTSDTEGRRAFTMTLQTREQHIRREKATSNICSNETLCAVATAVYLCIIGKNGLKKISEINYHNAHYMAKKLATIDDSIEVPKFEGDFFNEFLWSLPEVEGYYKFMVANRIMPGVRPPRALGCPENTLITAVTEMNTYRDINAMVDLTARYFTGGDR